MNDTKSHGSQSDALRQRLTEVSVAEQERVARAHQAAGEQHTRLALELYELLGVEPEHPITRIVEGEEVTVNVDEDESLRTQRVFEIIEAIADDAESELAERLTREDREGLEERRSKMERRLAESQDRQVAERV